jgi:hypothetical protein
MNKEDNEVSASEDSDTKVVGKQKQVYVPEIRLVDCESDIDEVSIKFLRTGRAIIAHATYVSYAPNGDTTIYKGTGYSIRNPEDREREDLGELLAAARAVNKLASLMYKDCMDKVHIRCNGKNHLRKYSEEDLVNQRSNINKELRERENRLRRNRKAHIEALSKRDAERFQEETGIISTVEVVHGCKRA